MTVIGDSISYFSLTSKSTLLMYIEISNIDWLSSLPIFPVTAGGHKMVSIVFSNIYPVFMRLSLGIVI